MRTEPDRKSSTIALIPLASESRKAPALNLRVRAEKAMNVRRDRAVAAHFSRLMTTVTSENDLSLSILSAATNVNADRSSHCTDGLM